MTTHLEEVVSEFDEKFGKDQYGGIEPFRQDKVKPFLINSHIAYLEKEIERLEKIKLTSPYYGSVKYPETYNNAIDDEISHKQQELLQAKELLK
jgi:hypothetical protein